MKQVNIQALPNQAFSIRLEDSRYDFVIKETNGVMSMDLARNNVQILSGHRMLSGTPLIPYKYQEEGNFVLPTLDDDLPFYTSFGITQFLFYLTAAEVAALRAS